MENWVAFDKKTEVIWGTGETAEDAMKDAKASFFDGQRGVGYEFACWCSDISVRECTAELRRRVESEGRLNVSEQTLFENLK
jgi:hypothetical protein